MPWELLADYLRLPVFALVAARLAGLLMFQPILGALAVPMNVRVLLVAGLAALITPAVALPAGAPDTPLGVALAMGAELLLGGVLGLVTVLCMLAMQTGAQLIAQESGLAFGQIVDPTLDEEETPIGVLYLQLTAVVFLIVGGHRALIGACLDSFERIPLLTAPDLTPATGLLTDALVASTAVALRVAAPTLIALFLVNVALGFISRTLPQLNIIAVSFSLKGLLAFAVIAASLPAAVSAFVDLTDLAAGWIQEFIHP